jgi:glycosyltransferase involved in cell wall biosynthesis
MRRVAVITTFVDLLEAFSLCQVVRMQLKSLLAAGYVTTFVACEGFRPEGVFAHPLLRHGRLPRHHVPDERIPVQDAAELRGAVAAIKERLGPLLDGIDVAITHDLVYLQQHLAYNLACRELARERPDLRWLHWVHSTPAPHRSLPEEDPCSARFRALPNALLVYPNAYDVARVARQYGVGEEHVRVVPHALDYEEAFDFHPLTRALMSAYDLYSPRILGVYPLRMDRGKQPEKVVRLFAQLKAAGQSVRLVVASFHSTGEHFVTYREEVRREALRLGLTDDEVLFTNRLEKLPGIDDADMARYRVELPHKVVMDLFHLTNVYVHPSAAETYSLVCQEAAATGNILFLNGDFPPMRDIHGPDAVYVKFSSSLFRTTYHPSELTYYADVARELLHVLQTERAIRQKTRLRRERNLGTVFRDHLEPLLYA